MSLVARDRLRIGPFNCRYHLQSGPTTRSWRIDESAFDRTASFPVGYSGFRSGLSATRRRRPALQHGILLQSSVGTPAGVPATVSEEPLSLTEEADRYRTSTVRESRDTCKPFA